MALDVTTPASELISQIIESMVAFTSSAENVLIKKESFKELASYLERIVPILRVVMQKGICNSESLNNAIEILNQQVKAVNQLTADCTNRNKVYLLMRCRSIVKQLEDTSRELSKALGLLPLASLDISCNIVEEVGKLRDSMWKAEFKTIVAEEEILQKINFGIQERNVNRSYANNLLAQIAEVVGIPNERSVLMKELGEFKKEIENARLRKEQHEAIQMGQIIALLERADAASSTWEKETRYFMKRNSLGSQPLEPLRSFSCPITGDVMVDPVETSSAQTFERSAIEKWFKDGHDTCPLTMIPLDTSILRPNKTLRQSISEWKDRNTMITIGSMKPKLVSEHEEEVLHCLEELEGLCEQADQHREWVMLENYIPILVKLLDAKYRNVRYRTLSVLNILAKDSDDAKERIINIETAIDSIVRFLSRHAGERKLSVTLLLELSKCILARDRLGQARGCMFLLVTMLSSDDSQAAAYAQQLLENLSFASENVLQMAKANYFKPLVERLLTGSEDVMKIMALNLAEMELTDHRKKSLIDEGALRPLLNMVLNVDVEMKTVGVKALRNLSSFPPNGLQMIREGAVRPLLDILFRYSSSPASLREQAAATLKNLAVSTVSQESSLTPICLIESEEDIIRLFSLINLTGSSVQHNILQIFCALCCSSSASNIIDKLSKCSAIQVLVLLCEHENLKVRASSVNLFYCLVGDTDEATVLEHVGQKCLKTFLGIIQTSSNVDEVNFAMGIVSNLPENSQITQWLLEAGMLSVICKVLADSEENGLLKNKLVENSVGAIRRFTVSTNLEWQKRTAEAGIIPLLVRLLDTGTTLVKKYAAISLTCFSESSMQLSRPILKPKGFWLCSVQVDSGCQIHGGICSVESSFCLVEADAVKPLVNVLQEPDQEVCEAALDALLTLINGERLQSGSALLEQAKAIPPLVKFLGSSSPRLQEKALNALERIFRMPELRQKYGPFAQLPLVELTQRGSNNIRSLSARVLAHLNVLHDQSSFFST